MPGVGLSLLLLSAALVGAVEPPKASLVLTTDPQGRTVFELRAMDADELPPADEVGHRFVAYAVFETQVSTPPPLAGEHSRVDDVIRFTPRFPLQPGMRYRAVYRTAGKEGANAKTILSEEFAVPARAAAAAARIAAVCPTAATLPENLLKFYIRFTAPMSRGGAYEHLRLLDADGQPVDLPFLELAEELWNPAGDRLTLLLDPGRIKQGLKPREEEGPVLARGRRYTLVVGRSWPDAAGQPLAAEFRKTFRVAAADETCPDPKAWRLSVPRAGSRTALVVDFGEPLDYALLLRMLWVVDGRGERVPGEEEIGEAETSWRFLPQEAWRPGEYRLFADTLLEDLAGNSIARRFELDAGREAKRETDQETASLAFRVGE